jgi:gliding motility-associated-like protein
MKKITLLGSLYATSLAALAGAPPKVVQPSGASALEFVANQKQWEKPVLFAADVPSGRLFLEHGRLVQALYDGKQLEELHHHAAEVPDKQLIKAHAYATTFVGANLQAAVRGENKLPGYSNFFLGNDQSRWASEVPGYADVRYEALYPGIDLHFYSKERVLEYDFEVAAGADAKLIKLRYNGQTKLQVVNGALHIGTSVGTVVEQRPYAYQLVGGRRQRVSCEYAIEAGNTVTFSLPKGYNKALPLVIDPVLVYSTYTGSSNNYGYTATYDSVGNLYAGGTVFSTGYPTTMGAFQMNHNEGTDMGIIKYDPRQVIGAASRVYATYVGGNEDDHPHSLVVDGNNNLIILGSTGSTNYPVSATGYHRTFGGGASDIVITKLNASGSALVGSTYLGGSGTDGRVITSTPLWENYGDAYRGDVTVDRNNDIYVASATASTNFPTSNSFQLTSGGGASDGVVVKLNPGLTGLVWSTYLGGNGADVAYSIQIDSVGTVFVSGGTTSRNFPGTGTSSGAFHTSYQGGVADGFVSRINAAGNDLARSTYIGTGSYDQAHFVQLNAQGEVYTYGQTYGNYPVSPGAYSNAGSRQFIQKLNSQLTTSLMSTVIGNGPGTDANMSPTAFLVDNCGQILLSGWTSQGNMPVTPDALQATGGSGNSSNSISAYFYIGQLSGDGSRLVYGTYFGNGNCHVDGGTSRFDKKGIIYQSMCTGSGNGPITTTPNAWSRTNNGGYNNAAFKMDVLQLDASFFPSSVQTTFPQLAVREQCAPARFYFNRQSQAGTGFIWDFGNGQTSTSAGTSSVLYTSAGKYTVRLTVYDSTSCVQSVTFTDTVRVSGLPRAAAGPDKSVCPGYSATLTVADAGARATYTWSPATGLNTTTGRTVVATPTVTTRYIVQVNIPSSLNCIGYDTVVVNVRAPLAVTAGPDREVCPGASTTLVAPDFGPGSTYSWSPATGLSSTSGASVTAMPTATMRYTVVATDANGCSGQATVELRVPNRPVIAATVSAPNLVNQPISFVNTTTGANGYRWDFGDGTPVSTEINPTHVYTTARPQPYQATLTALYGTGCEETITLPVRTLGLPNVLTPNGDGLNDTFRPYVTTDPVTLEVFNRWGRKVYEQANYTDGWGGADVPAGTYYYHITSPSGESWKGWFDVVKN